MEKTDKDEIYSECHFEQLNEENKASVGMTRRTNKEELETEVGYALKLFLERVTIEGNTLNIALIGASDIDN